MGKLGVKEKMHRARTQIKRKYRGYGSRRSFLHDMKRKAKHKPAKRYKKGIGHKGDWKADEDYLFYDED